MEELLPAGDELARASGMVRLESLIYPGDPADRHRPDIAVWCGWWLRRWASKLTSFFRIYRETAPVQAVDAM